MIEYPNVADQISRLAAENAALKARCKVLEDALAPFVQTAKETRAYGADGVTTVRVGDCRAARKAMESPSPIVEGVG